VGGGGGKNSVTGKKNYYRSGKREGKLSLKKKGLGGGRLGTKGTYIKKADHSNGAAWG